MGGTKLASLKFNPLSNPLSVSLFPRACLQSRKELLSGGHNHSPKPFPDLLRGVHQRLPSAVMGKTGRFGFGSVFAAFLAFSFAANFCFILRATSTPYPAETSRRTAQCQGRSKTRPLGRSKSRPVDSCSVVVGLRGRGASGA